MNLYIYRKSNNEFYKMDVPVEKETPKMLYFDKAAIRRWFNDLKLQYCDEPDSIFFNKVINDSKVNKEFLPLVSLGLETYMNNPSIGAMYVLSATEMSLEEIKSLWSMGINNNIERQEHEIAYKNEILSETKRLLTNVNILLDEEPKEEMDL